MNEGWTAGVYSYGIASVAYLLLSILLAAGWRGRGPGLRLVVACGVTVLWAASLAVLPNLEVASAYHVALVESLRDSAWILVLAGLAAPAGVARGLSRGLMLGCAVAIGYTAAAPLLDRSGYSVLLPSVALVGVGFLLALGGLLLLEQVYRNSRGEGRAALGYLVLALGTMWVYDIFLYSQAQMMQGVVIESWDARGIVFTLVVPALALAARRNPQWSLDIFVSRQVVFYTTTLLAVGAYLLAMALGGYLLRLLGGEWGAILEVAFITGAGVVLLVLIASGSLRRRLRVFLAKHFYRNRYDYRVEWLRFIETLSTPDEALDAYETPVRAIAQVFGSPGGVLYVRRDASECYEAVAAWPQGSADLSRFPPIAIGHSLPQFMARRQWVVDLEERRRDPDFYDGIMLPAPFDTAGPHRMLVPLLHRAELVGIVALESPPPPFDPNYEDRDLLKTLGRHVAAHLAQHEADRRLAENRQFEAYHRLTSFVMHDLKNLAAQLALVVANAEKHRRNPEFVDDAIGTIANSTERMQRLIAQLQRREAQGSRQRVLLADVARQACDRCSARLPRPVLQADPLDVTIVCDPERLSSVLEHLIRNAQDATPEEGRVSVGVTIGAPGPARERAVPVTETNGLLRVPHAVVEVADNGCGMTAEFVRDRLFTPFDTTKGSKGMGIGAYQVREYVNSLGGRVEVESSPGEGTRVRLLLPLAGN